MVYHDVAGGFAALLNGLQSASVPVPSSLERLRDPQQHTVEHLREAAADTVPIAEEQGDDESAQLLSDALSLATADEPEVSERKYQELWTGLSEYAKRNKESIVRDVVIALVFGLLFFVAELVLQDAPDVNIDIHNAPPLVVPEPEKPAPPPEPAPPVPPPTKPASSAREKPDKAPDGVTGRPMKSREPPSPPDG